MTNLHTLKGLRRREKKVNKLTDKLQFERHLITAYTI